MSDDSDVGGVRAPLYCSFKGFSSLGLRMLRASFHFFSLYGVFGLKRPNLGSGFLWAWLRAWLLWSLGFL